VPVEQVQPGEMLYREVVKYFLIEQFYTCLPFLEAAAQEHYPAAYLLLALLSWVSFQGSIDKAQSELWNAKTAESIGWFKAQGETGEVEGNQIWDCVMIMASGWIRMKLRL